ncbi:hypothetical protein LINPERHAP2_LOCUS39222 [Linum perenne]
MSEISITSLLAKSVGFVSYLEEVGWSI